MKILILNEQDLKHCFDIDRLIIFMQDALISYSEKQSKNFPRTVFNLDNEYKNPIGFMPAFDLKQAILGYKVITVFHQNSLSQINPHQGIVVLVNEQTGQLKCILDGSFITAVRTAAVSAVATNRLSRPDSTKLALIGAGRQAVEHVHAISRIRPIRSISVYARSIESFNQFQQQVANDDIEIKQALTPQEAIDNADIIVTCTSSRDCLFDIMDVPEGVHINAIGACRPGEYEISLRNRMHLKIYMDSIVSCFLESDEIIQPINSKRLSRDYIVGEIGECLAGILPSRVSTKEITLFKSVGLSIEDIYAAECLYQTAIQSGIGQVINF